MLYTHVVYVFQHMRGKIFLMSQLLQLSTSLSYFKTLTQSCQIPDDGKVNINTEILVVSFWTTTWEISLKTIILRILENCIPVVCKNSAESFYRVSWNKHNILALLKWYLINLTIFLRHHAFLSRTGLSFLHSWKAFHSLATTDCISSTGPDSNNCSTNSTEELHISLLNLASSWCHSMNLTL